MKIKPYLVVVDLTVGFVLRMEVRGRPLHPLHPVAKAGGMGSV